MNRFAEPNEMMSNYFETVFRSWNDEEYKLRLSESPREALAETGWEVPADVGVEVTFYDPDEFAGREPPSAGEMTGHWAQGIESGNLKIAISDRVPEKLETIEMSEDELEKVGGGHCAGDYCVPCGL